MRHPFTSIRTVQRSQGMGENARRGTCTVHYTTISQRTSILVEFSWLSPRVLILASDPPLSTERLFTTTYITNTQSLSAYNMGNDIPARIFAQDRLHRPRHPSSRPTEDARTRSDCGRQGMVEPYGSHLRHGAPHGIH